MIIMSNRRSHKIMRDRSNNKNKTNNKNKNNKNNKEK
jgi:hypothetical protein